MKTIRFSATVVLFAVLTLATGCKKENGTRQVSVSIQSFTSGSKVYLNSYKPTWAPGDEIQINSTAHTLSEGSYVTVNESEGTTLHAFYPATAVTSYTSGSFSVVIPTVQSYSVDASGHQTLQTPMAATGTNNLSFQNLCALLAVQVPAGKTVYYIDVTTADRSAVMSGKGTVSFSGATSTLTYDVLDNMNTYPYIRLDCGDAGVTRTDNTFYVMVPPVSGKKFCVTLCLSDNGVKKRKTFTQTAAVTIQNSQYGPVNLSAASFENNATILNPPTDGLPEPFSISATEKAYFSRGNLKYFMSNLTWQLTDKQYRRIGAKPGNTNMISDSIDLFGWSATGRSGCLAPGTHISRSNNYYEINNSPSTTMDNSTDWGANISTNEVVWHTPTEAEWIYFINHYQRALAEIKYNANTTYKGVIIIPDYWVSPNECKIDINATRCSVNCFTTEQWERMERNGALFLPFTGLREGVNVKDDNYVGYYWSRSIDGSANAKVLHLEEFTTKQQRNNVAEVISKERYYGCAVRLINTIQEQ